MEECRFGGAVCTLEAKWELEGQLGLWALGCLTAPDVQIGMYN